jgi:hypothetical protein
MFPIAQGATAGLGLGLEAYGAYAGIQAQTGIQNAQAGIIAGQQQIQKLNYNQMQLQARRAQMEVVRNSQRARALALNNAVSSGSQFGSGLSGGYGQISGQSKTNELGISQNLEIGKQEYQANQAIDAAELQMSKYKGQQATAQGFSSLGSSLLGSSQAAGNLFG